jgi:hypothetical protein
MLMPSITALFTPAVLRPNGLKIRCAEKSGNRDKIDTNIRDEIDMTRRSGQSG